MKVAYISTAEVPSSRANSFQVMKVCQAMVKLGHSVELYLPAGREVEWTEIAALYGLQESFPIVRLPSRQGFNRFDFIAASLRRARRGQADLIYSRMIWAALFARQRGFAAVLEMHDLPHGRFAPAGYRAFLRRKPPKLTVYITEALRLLSNAQTGVSAREGEYLIAPDGVDLERYQHLPSPSQARQMLGLPERFTAVYSGSFYPGRGLEILFPLAQAFPQVHFLWIGGDSKQTADWIEKLNTAGITNVTLTGFIPNQQIPLYQATADVLLMPFSRSFGGSSGGDTSRICSPLKTFEYMATGRAILASDLPVMREVLNESNVCFYTPEDFDSLSNQFSKLISDAQWRAKLAATALENAAAYDWRRRMATILEVISAQMDAKK